MKTAFETYLENLRRLEADGDVVACFDLDRTLISGYSLTALVLEKFRSGLSPRRMMVHLGIFLGYGLGRSDYHDLLERTVGALAGRPEAEILELGERAFERRLAETIYDEARQLVALHQEKGHRVVIATSATRYQAEPVARALGVEDLVCTELEIERGIITGNVTSCYGAGKRAAAEALILRVGADLADAFFYSDSSEDLPLLEAVGRPVVANPKAALAKIAAARGWTQLTFAAQGDRQGDRDRAIAA